MENVVRTINISTDYTPFLGGRYEEDGEGNGTTFREEFLKPVMDTVGAGPVDIVLDGAAGYPSSFLEEAFGGLVREHGYSADQVLSKFNFIAHEPGFSRYIAIIKEYIRLAKPKPSET